MPEAWRQRCRRAEKRFSPEGRAQWEQVQRVRALAKEHKIQQNDLVAIIGGVKTTARWQLEATARWGEGVLERLADLFGVPVAHLRDGAPVDTVAAAPAVVAAGLPAAAAGRDPPPQEILRLGQRHWHMGRAIETLVELEQLVAAGVGVDKDALRAYVEHARDRETIAEVTAALLAGDPRE